MRRTERGKIAMKVANAQTKAVEQLHSGPDVKIKALTGVDLEIGKGEISDAMLDSIDEALEKRELIKISVLETADLTAKDAAEMIAAATGSEVIQCIGRKFVLYRKRQEQ